MSSILIYAFTLVLVVVCLALVLLVLMQKPSADSGMGGLGGGAAEGVFGGEAGNVLTKLTVRSVIIYFVIAFGLYLGYIYISSHAAPEEKSVTAMSAVNAINGKAEPKAEESATAAKPDTAAPAQPANIPAK